MHDVVYIRLQQINAGFRSSLVQHMYTVHAVCTFVQIYTVQSYINVHYLNAPNRWGGQQEVYSGWHWLHRPRGTSSSNNKYSQETLCRAPAPNASHIWAYIILQINY